MARHHNADNSTEPPLSYGAATATEALECAPRRPRQPYPPAPAGLDLERALTTREAGSLLGLNEITLQQQRARGEGPPFFRVGGGKRQAIRYVLRDVLAFRESNMVGKAP